MLKNVISKFRSLLLEKLYRNNLLNGKSIDAGGTIIHFHDIYKSNILLQIALSGYESFEKEVVDLIKNYPWKLNKFIDGGANIGFYSILGSIYFPETVEIIAVEPFSENIEYLKEIKHRHNLRFDIIPRAIDECDEKEVILYFPVHKSSSKLSASASLINSFKGTGGIFNHLPYKTQKVFTISLGKIIGDHDNDCLIKLDCEGNELKILESSNEILVLDNMDFIIEIMINNEDKYEVFNTMKNYGYDSYLITNSGMVREDRPLTFPFPDRNNRTIWKNHFFTKRNAGEIKKLSEEIYGYWI